MQADGCRLAVLRDLLERALLPRLAARHLGRSAPRSERSPLNSTKEVEGRKLDRATKRPTPALRTLINPVPSPSKTATCVGFCALSPRPLAADFRTVVEDRRREALGLVTRVFRGLLRVIPLMSGLHLVHGIRTACKAH